MPAPRQPTTPGAPRILLLHGTFARRSPWTFPGSPLHECLTSRFPGAVIDRHEWSGSNRHKARNQAAESLRQDLSRKPGPTVVIAHSHGGNVAQMALGWDQSLQSRSELIAVGTPFLHLEDRRRDPDIHRGALLSPGRVTWLAFSAAMGAALSLSMLVLGRQPGPAAQESGQSSDVSTWEPLNGFSATISGVSLASFAVAVLAVLIVGVVGAMSLMASLWQPPSMFFRGLLRWTRRGARPGRDQGQAHSPDTDAALRLVPLDPSPPSVTTIRTRNDEAALALRFGTILATLVDRSRWALDRLPTWVVAPTFAVALWLVIALEIASPGEAWIAVPAFVALSIFPQPELLSVVAALASVPAAMALAVSLVALLEAVACGFDGVPLLAHGRVSMRAEPQRQGDRHVAQLDRGFKVSLRHCRLMEDPGSVEVIAEACAASLRSLNALDGARRPRNDT